MHMFLIPSQCPFYSEWMNSLTVLTSVLNILVKLKFGQEGQILLMREKNTFTIGKVVKETTFGKD